MGEIEPGKYLTLTSGDSLLRVHYHEMGPAGGPPLIFVQTGGAATDAWMCWYLTLPAFAEAGYHVFAPDSLGFGDTALIRGANLPGPDFLLAFLSAVGVEGAHFIGNSGGTMAITLLASSHPERVLSFTASGGEPRAATADAVSITPRLGRTARMAFVRNMLTKPEVSVADMRQATSAFFFDSGHRRVAEVAEMRLANLRKPGVQEKERQGAFAQIQGGRQLLSDEVFQRIEAPTYLLHGRDEPGFYDSADQSILLDAALRPMHLVPRCDSTVLSNCGHWPQLEVPDRYVSLCLDFLGSLA